MHKVTNHKIMTATHLLLRGGSVILRFLRGGSFRSLPSTASQLFNKPRHEMKAGTRLLCGGSGLLLRLPGQSGFGCSARAIGFVLQKERWLRCKRAKVAGWH